MWLISLSHPRHGTYQSIIRCLSSSGPYPDPAFSSGISWGGVGGDDRMAYDGIVPEKQSLYRKETDSLCKQIFPQASLLHSV